MYNVIFRGGYSSANTERRASGSRLVLRDRIEERRSEV